MHPLLASRARLGAYLLGWTPITALLTGLARIQGWSWAEATALALPLCLGAAFLFLTAWYLCRAMPLDGNLARRVVRAVPWFAAAMGLVILYPQTTRSAANPNRCWARIGRPRRRTPQTRSA